MKKNAVWIAILVIFLARPPYEGEAAEKSMIYYSAEEFDTTMDTIKSLDPENGKVTTLFESKTGLFGFDVSGDGSIVFSTCPSEKQNDKCILNLKKGSNIVTILDHENLFPSDARFSPDGKKICFTGMSNFRASIYLINSDGTGVTMIAECCLGGFKGFSCFSSNDTIVFSCIRKGRFGLSSYNLKTTSETRIIDLQDMYSCEYLSVSADGREIVFKGLSGKQNLISIVQIDGTGLHEVYKFPYEPYTAVMNPRFSPDGKCIIFSMPVKPSRTMEICRIKADGSGLQVVTTPDKTHKHTAAWL
ncbi:MAG: hypothetical protein PHW04_09010 [Candidatus Wallbacteria bacterium]|nr:hypothetical protein [Candidatus Wallbacteria bacterium]